MPAIRHNTLKALFVSTYSSVWSHICAFVVAIAAREKEEKVAHEVQNKCTTKRTKE